MSEPISTTIHTNLSTTTAAESGPNFIEQTFGMNIPVFAVLCVNVFMAVACALFILYLVVRITCKNRPLPSLERLTITSRMLNNKKEIQGQHNVIVELCGANRIRASKVLKDYEHDSMQRRASVYATFGLADAFSSNRNREADYYKQLIDQFINWDQNVYMREGRKGEPEIMEKYGMPPSPAEAKLEKNEG